VVLLAPRRFGKTSLVLETISRLKKNDLFTAYIDIFASPEKRILSEKITEAVLANKKLHKAFANFRKNFSSLMHQVEFKQAVENFEFILKFAEKNQDELTLLSDSIDFIDEFAHKYRKQIICSFDEFGDIEKLNGAEIVKLFRSKIQLQKNATYIFSGSQESVMEKIFITSKSPFYRFARIISIDEIDPAVFSSHIRKEFNKMGIVFKDDAMNTLMNFTKGHPYYTQLICKQLEFKLAGSNIKRIDDEELLAAIDAAYWSEINYIEKFWDELSASKEQVSILLAVAKGVTSIYNYADLNKLNVSRALRKLRLKGILKKKNNVNVFIDPMLKYFIRKDILKWNVPKCIR